MTKKKGQNPKFLQSASTAENLSPVTSTISSPTAPNATEQKPKSSQNKLELPADKLNVNRLKSESSPNKSPAGKVEADDSGRLLTTSTASPPQPQISEEDRKALENLSTAIGIPQLVTEIKKQREEINQIMTTLSGKPSTAGGPPPIGGAAAGFLKPIMDKAPELIDGIMKWISGTSSPAPTMISGIDKEIMEAAIKQTMQIKQKVATASDALTRIYIGGGGVDVHEGEGETIVKITKPKTEEIEKK